MTKAKLAQYGAVGFAVLFSLPALGKMAGMQPLVDQLSVNGVGEWTAVIGFGLLVSVILFAVPKTKLLGTLLLSAYFGGAIVFHMGLGEPFVLQAIILLVVWILAYLRGAPLLDKTPAATPEVEEPLP